MKIAMIVAMTAERVIGYGNALPWKLPRDMKHFVEVTRGKTVIMGRKCFDSIGRPLPNRHNIVLTRDKNFKAEGCVVVHSTHEALEEAFRHDKEQAEANPTACSRFEPEVMIIGGEEIYKLFLPLTNKLYVTRIEASIVGDTFFPALGVNDWLLQSSVPHMKDEDNEFTMHFQELVRR